MKTAVGLTAMTFTFLGVLSGANTAEANHLHTLRLIDRLVVRFEQQADAALHHLDSRMRHNRHYGHAVSDLRDLQFRAERLHDRLHDYHNCSPQQARRICRDIHNLEHALSHVTDVVALMRRELDFAPGFHHGHAWHVAPAGPVNISIRGMSVNFPVGGPQVVHHHHGHHGGANLQDRLAVRQLEIMIANMRNTLNQLVHAESRL